MREGGIPRVDPCSVITNIAVMHCDEFTRVMYLAGCYLGITPEQFFKKTEFSVDVSRAEEFLPPSPEDVRILRELCDPRDLLLGEQPADNQLRRVFKSRYTKEVMIGRKAARGHSMRSTSGDLEWYVCGQEGCFLSAENVPFPSVRPAGRKRCIVSPFFLNRRESCAGQSGFLS
jgi:hypothetical protein